MPTVIRSLCSALYRIRSAGTGPVYPIVLHSVSAWSQAWYNLCIIYICQIKFDSCGKHNTPRASQTDWQSVPVSRFPQAATRRATHKSVARTWLALLHKGVCVCEREWVWIQHVERTSLYVKRSRWARALVFWKLLKKGLSRRGETNWKGLGYHVKIVQTWFII